LFDPLPRKVKLPPLPTEVFNIGSYKRGLRKSEVYIGRVIPVSGGIDLGKSRLTLARMDRERKPDEVRLMS
jgi:hypothetical protein